MHDPADVVGETVIDCRPSVLPVRYQRRGRVCVTDPQTGKSIMDMDTNEITLNRIVGFEWDKAGTDLEDEMPTPVLSPM